MNERAIVNTIERHLRRTYKGCVLFKINDQFTAGIPDLWFCHMGWSAWIETKKPGARRQRHEALQDWVRAQIILNGGRAYQVKSLDELQTILARDKNVNGDVMVL